MEDGSRTGGASKLKTIGDILRQRCPRCRTGNIFPYSVFRGFPRMHERCPACGLKFEREPGYFLGAMYVSYGLGIGIIGSRFAIWPVSIFVKGEVMRSCLRITGTSHSERAGMREVQSCTTGVSATTGSN